MTSINNHIKGDTWPGIAITVSKNGNPLDYEGASIKMQVKKNYSFQTFVGEWSTDDETIIFTETPGEFILLERIVDFEVGTYHYDIQVTLGDGTVVTVIQGTWEITYDVTR